MGECVATTCAAHMAGLSKRHRSVSSRSLLLLTFSDRRTETSQLRHRRAVVFFALRESWEAKLCVFRRQLREYKSWYLEVGYSKRVLYTMIKPIPKPPTASAIFS